MARCGPCRNGFAPRENRGCGFCSPFMRPPASHVVAGVGEYVAAYSNTASPPRRHGRPVVPDHQRNTQGPGSTPQPGLVVDAKVSPERLPCGRIKDLPGDDEVDGWVA